MDLGYVFQQGDAVLIAVFLLLLAMSVLSWAIIFWKAWKLHDERQHIAAFAARGPAPDWPKRLQETHASGALRTLLREAEHIRPHAAAHSLPQAREMVALHLSQTLDILRARFDAGLTALASIGSSAPFIGLFGTIWGVYRTLIRVAAERSTGLDVVAGPMGEALVATAAGLFVAIPAVLAYNAFLRVNRLAMQDLRHVAEWLAAYLPLSPADAGGKSPAPLKAVQGA